jgi:undecaprenyl-diphosphatase
MRDLSGLGSMSVLPLFTLTSAFHLALVATRAIAGLIVGSVLGGALAVEAFKAGFGCLRSDALFAELVAPGLSFPSGHASIGAVAFPTLGTLLATSCLRLARRIYIL